MRVTARWLVMLLAVLLVGAAGGGTRAEDEQEEARVAVTAGKDGFSIRTADGTAVLRLRGYAQADGRFVDGGPTDTFLVRRARPIFEGTVGPVDFRIMPDFGGGTTVLQDGWLDLRVAKPLRVRAGKFKSPFGLERLQSATDLFFVERAFPTSLVPNRDVGLELHGDVATLTWSLAALNGVPDGGSADIDANEGKDVVARLFVQPFRDAEGSALRGLGLGVAASTGDQVGTATQPGLAAYRTPAQQTFFSYVTDAVAAGRRTRWSPQGYVFTGPLGLLAEYVRSEQEVALGGETAELTNDAWQLAGMWVLGGTPSYRGTTPRTPFDADAGTWGALEIKARLSGLDVDEATFPTFADPLRAARSARSYAAGLTWVLTRNVKTYLDYELTRFEGGAADGADRPDERVLFTRLQVSF